MSENQVFVIQDSSRDFFPLFFFVLLFSQLACSPSLFLGVEACGS